MSLNKSLENILNFVIMKKLNNVESAELEEVTTTVSKILIHTMNHFDLQTHIEMTSVSDGNRYVLRFDKEKI